MTNNSWTDNLKKTIENIAVHSYISNYISTSSKDRQNNILTCIASYTYYPYVQFLNVVHVYKNIHYQDPPDTQINIAARFHYSQCKSVDII